MDLNGATWMVRQLEQPVSMVHLDEHHGVFAGGWDGRVTHWDEAGEHVWTAQTNDRISALALSEDVAVVASGLHIVALDRATGEERWSMALEGSADAVVWWQGDVVAVSSVYDIEHNDFIESAIWRFSPDGDLQWVERMDERPWTLIEVDDRLLAGLGRPRCGHLDVSSTPPFNHTLPPTSSPTTCGTGGRTQGLFGQTDGKVVSHEGAVLSTETGAIEHLTCMVKGYVA
ncbi:MAG: PQQ-binding-like beta-propeller repeat protein, partial [Candidatus Poseidoniaceae archaeon]